ncbi:MAG: LysM domain-containing protein [Chloroflexota bacterium]|nr:LysM domain-containing protein [Chloroflexota bacterium]
MPELDYQSSTCLTQRHEACPLFTSSPGEKMPEDIRHRSENIQDPKFYLKIIPIGALVALIMLSAIFYKQWFPKINNFLRPAWQQTQQAHPVSFLPTETQCAPTFTSIETSTPTARAQPTSTPVNSPSPTFDPSASPEDWGYTSVFALDTPIGKINKFIIHRAVAGESIGQYASRYNTTIHSIYAVNNNLPSVLYIDQILVIPVDIVDVSDLPTFETYQVKETGLTVPQIVEQLSIATDAFRIYNNIPLNYVFNSGDWVLVPRQRP